VIKKGKKRQGKGRRLQSKLLRRKPRSPGFYQKPNMDIKKGRKMRRELCDKNQKQARDPKGRYKDPTKNLRKRSDHSPVSLVKDEGLIQKKKRGPKGKPEAISV